MVTKLYAFTFIEISNNDLTNLTLNQQLMLIVNTPIKVIQDNILSW